MSTQQTKGTNGTAKPAEITNGKPVATVVELTPKKTDQEAPKPTVEGKKLSDLPPVEDRVLKVQQLFDLTAKREKLQESLKKLNSIKTSTESRDLKITIEDSDSEWETFNTDAIKACIDCMKETIKRKLDEVENLIRF
jgi:predicted RNase H-like nuclease (RuvC/YqgF family)